RVLQLLLQHLGGSVGVRRPLFKPVILPHRLIIQILTVHHEQHLLHRRHPGRQLGGLERRERLTRPSGMPYIPTRIIRAELIIVRRHLNPAYTPLSSNYLRRAHHQQRSIPREYALPREDVQQRVLSEERLRKRRQILDRFVIPIGPPRSQLKTI